VPCIVTPRVDGRAIAFACYFALRGRMIGYRTAFDPAFASFSPGLLVHLGTIEAAAADGLTTIEFLGGDDPYKALFAGGTNPTHEPCGLATTARGRAWVAWRAAAVRLRRRLERSPYHGGGDRLRRWSERVRWAGAGPRNAGSRSREAIVRVDAPEMLDALVETLVRDDDRGAWRGEVGERRRERAEARSGCRHGMIEERVAPRAGGGGAARPRDGGRAARMPGGGEREGGSASARRTLDHRHDVLAAPGRAASTGASIVAAPSLAFV